MATTIRIDEQAHSVLRDLARAEHQPMQAILAKAVENYRRDRFLQRANLAFAALRDDPAAWSEEDEERRLWERTLDDRGEDR